MRTDFQNVLVEEDESVVTLTMNRPDVLNAINTLMLQELTKAVEAAAHNDAIRCVVLTGAGRAFGAFRTSLSSVLHVLAANRSKSPNTWRSTIA